MTIIITGASSGIGFELLRRFLRDGHTVHAISRNTDKLEKLKNDYEDFYIHQVDVTDFARVQSISQAICEKAPRIDIVIANAGISVGHSTQITPFADFKNVIDTNFTSVHALFEPVMHKMLAQGGGKLVAVSSLASFVAMPTTAAYSSSKRALNSYMDSLRLSLSPYGIDVVNIQPGFIKTAMTDKNSFSMPFLMELDDGVDEIVYAIEKGKANHAFPFAFSTFVKCLTLMPTKLRDRLILKLSRKAYDKR